MVGTQHALGIGHPRGRDRRVVVDDVTAKDRQLDLADELGARLLIDDPVTAAENEALRR